NNARSDENQSLGSSVLRLRLPLRIPRVRACISSSEAMPIRNTFMARFPALSEQHELPARNLRVASGHLDRRMSASYRADGGDRARATAGAPRGECALSNPTSRVPSGAWSVRL